MDIQELYEQYFTAVYRYLLSLSGDRHIAEEITQETFFKALQKIDHFDGSCNIRTWLCQIGKNTYLDYLRKHKRLTSWEEGPDIPSNQDIEWEYEQADRAGSIHNALNDLPEPYKEVFMLRFYGELSFREISRLYGKSESWSKMTYLRAKNKIREAVGDE